MKQARKGSQEWVEMTRIAMIVSLVIVLLGGMAVMPAQAQTGGTYVVQAGDTLAGIAARHGVTVSQLATANGLGWSAWVYVGQTLVIPGGSQAPVSPGGSYVVQPGDTLYSIAVRYGTTVAALLAVNNLANPNFVYVGQRLEIPGAGSSPTPVPSQPSPGVSYGAKWIDINLSSQMLAAYEGQTPVFSAVVSTGQYGTPTVVGTYSIYAKYASSLMAGPGYYLPDVPYAMYFYRGYSIHGTYWHNNFGTPMSHGCVNMSVDDAAWLFNWAPMGTTVVTHY
jgi:LysM repeat protein